MGVPSADLERGKGKHTTKKESHECRKTSRIRKTFPSAELELDKERSQELFTLSVLLHRGEKGAGVPEIQEYLDFVKS